MITNVVRVLPVEARVEVAAGEPLMQAAQRQGLAWPTLCQGQAQCGLCWCVVQEGAENLSPLRERERERLLAVGRADDARVRLACQVRVHGPATVFRTSVRALRP